MEKKAAERFLTIIFNNEDTIRGMMIERINDDLAEAMNGDITTERFDNAVAGLMAIIGGMEFQEYLEWVTINKTLPALAVIAKREMGVESFEVFNSDEKDFHSVATWSIETALFEAFQLGKKAANNG